MMEQTYRKLKPLVFAQAVHPSLAVGDRAELCLLPLDRLVVDERYQRAIGKAGRPNIQRILAGFDWRKFTPVVVTPVGDGLFAIIDGQHRATAALMHPGIDMVPCMVIKVTPDEAAACFAAINGCVTSVTRGQIWKARVTAKESSAVALQAVLDAAAVKVLPYKMPDTPYRPGETLAIGTLERMLKQHGPDVLTIALTAITQSGAGNPGCVVAPVIIALCEIVAEIDVFRLKPTKLFDLMDEVNLDRLILESAADAKLQRRPPTAVVKQVLAHYLMGAMGRAYAPAAKPEAGAA